MRINPYFDPRKPGEPAPVEFTIENGVLLKCTTYADAVTVPDGVTAIGDRAFQGCRFLTGVRIPDSVRSWGEHPFNWCRDITLFHCPDRLLEGMSLMGAMDLFDETYMNHPNMANRFIRNVLEGTGDFSPGFRRMITNALYSPFFRATWIGNSIREQKPQWLELILEHSSRLTLRELEHCISLAAQEANAQCGAMLMNYKTTRYTPEEIEQASRNALNLDGDI